MQNCLCFCLRDFGRLLKSEYKPMLTLLTVRIHHKDFYGFSLFCVHFFFFLHSFRLFNVFFHRCWKFNCSDFLCDFTWYFYFYSLSVVRLTLVCLFSVLDRDYYTVKLLVLQNQVDLSDSYWVVCTFLPLQPLAQTADLK